MWVIFINGMWHKMNHYQANFSTIMSIIKLLKPFLLFPLQVLQSMVQNQFTQLQYINQIFYLQNWTRTKIMLFTILGMKFGNSEKMKKLWCNIQAQIYEWQSYIDRDVLNQRKKCNRSINETHLLQHHMWKKQTLQTIWNSKKSFILWNKIYWLEKYLL